MTNCKHFVVQWVGPRNVTSLQEKLSNLGRREPWKKKSFSDLFIFEELLGSPQNTMAFPSLPRLDNLIQPLETGSPLFFFAVAFTYPLRAKRV